MRRRGGNAHCHRSSFAATRVLLACKLTRPPLVRTSRGTYPQHLAKLRGEKLQVIADSFVARASFDRLI